MAFSANETPTIRVLVVGDSGVGKTSLVHQLTHSKPQPSTSWTVGCDVQILPFEVERQPYFVEFWDVGGSPRYSASRSTFYHDFDGLMLVHDLNNKISYDNLRSWHTEVTSVSSGGAGTADPEELIGTGGLHPTLVVGTNADRAPPRKAGALARDLSASSVDINNLGAGAMAAGSVAQRALHEYYTAVINKKFRRTRADVGGRRRQAGGGNDNYGGSGSVGGLFT